MSAATCQDYRVVGSACCTLACAPINRNASVDQRICVLLSTTAGYTITGTLIGCVAPGPGNAIGAAIGVSVGFLVGLVRIASS